jgi:flagellar basal-body rod modification protein FlgD
MTTVSAAAGNAPTNSNPALPQPQSLNSLDFLKILVAEFQNQDPTAPTDPTQFASQMVQFANLGQLESIDKSVQKTSSSDLMQAASAFIGREVATAGNTVGVKNGKSTSIAYAPPGADSYRAIVFDANGQQVDEVSLGQFNAGSLQDFTWKPSSSIGDGLYTVKIVNSNNVALGGLLEQGVVQSVALSNSGIALDLGNLVVSADAIATVAQP